MCYGDTKFSVNLKIQILNIIIKREKKKSKHAK